MRLCGNDGPRIPKAVVGNALGLDCCRAHQQEFIFVRHESNKFQMLFSFSFHIKGRGSLPSTYLRV